VGKFGLPEASFAEVLVTVPLLLAAVASTSNALVRATSLPSSQPSITDKLLPAGLCFDCFKVQ